MASEFGFGFQNILLLQYHLAIDKLCHKMTRVGVIVQKGIRLYRQSLIFEPDDNLLKDEDVRSQPEV